MDQIANDKAPSARVTSSASFNAAHRLAQLELNIDFEIRRAQAGAKDGHEQTAAFHAWQLAELTEQKAALAYARVLLEAIGEAERIEAAR